jgi:hypothetical protein
MKTTVPHAIPMRTHRDGVNKSERHMAAISTPMLVTTERSTMTVSTIGVATKGVNRTSMTDKTGGVLDIAVNSVTTGWPTAVQHVGMTIDADHNPVIGTGRIFQELVGSRTMNLARSLNMDL